jgi:ferredoxin
MADDLHVVDHQKCTGDGLCVAVCPAALLALLVAGVALRAFAAPAAEAAERIPPTIKPPMASFRESGVLPGDLENLPATIEVLDLSNCRRLRDADLLLLARLSNLRELDVNQAKVKVATLKKLADLPALQVLRVSGMALDGDDVRALRTAFPNARVWFPQESEERRR